MNKFLVMIVFTLVGCDVCYECSYQGDNPYPEDYSICKSELNEGERIKEVVKLLETQGYECENK